MPDDLDHLHVEVMQALNVDVTDIAFQEHRIFETKRPRRRITLRCRLWGCTPMPACPWEPECGRCLNHCRRCRRPVIPRMVAKGRSI